MRELSDPKSLAAWGQTHLRRILNEPDFFRLIFDALPLQVVVKSLAEPTFGQFLLWNRVAEEWLGLSADDVIGRTDYEFFPREQADFFAETDRRVARGREPLEIAEEAISSRDKGERWLHTIKTPIFDDAGNPLALLVVSEDITERKRAAEELQSTLRRLREERNLFHTLLDHLPLGAFAKSARPESFGEYLLWNRVMGELHGHSAEEVLGRRAEELFAAEAAAVYSQQDRETIATRQVREFALHDGEREGRRGRLMRAIKAPVLDPDGEPLAIIGIAEDVSERVRGEQERQQAMEMLRQLNSQVPGALYKMRGTGATGRQFLYVSERIEEIYGIPAKRFVEDAATIFAFMAPEDVERIEAAEREALAVFQPFRADFRITRSDGQKRWLEANAVPRGDGDDVIWFGFLTDITDRKRAEEALQESKHRWELALAGTEAGVWDWNVRSGEVFYSERWRQMFGYLPDDLPPTPSKLLELVHPEERERVRQSTVDVLRRRRDLFRCEYRMRRSDGQWLWILAHAKAHFDADGQATRMIGTLIDISARKEVEAQLLEAKVAAENASRAKSDFLAMMSHEIRTPLNGVLGFAELLADTELDIRQREFLQTIRESGANLLHVLNDILDYSKIESGKLDIDRQPAATEDIVTNSVETFRAKAAAKNLRLEWEIGPEVPATIVTDALRLRQILTNLVSNAVKFTARGRVCLRVTAPSPPADDGRLTLCFEVIDTGIGVPAEDLPRLFQPFEQFDVSMARRFGGTGLGLSIVQRLVAMMEGTIGATSHPGEGTTFRVELPVAVTSAPAPRTLLPVRTAPATGAPLTILLVEDNAVNRRLAMLMLQRLGYTADEAPDGARAVELAEGRAYDLVLMDIQMPGMDGYEAARQIRLIQPDCWIVALTAHALAADRDRSTNQGFAAHLTKPLRAEELAGVLRRVAASPSKSPGVA